LSFEHLLGPKAEAGGLWLLPDKAVNKQGHVATMITKPHVQW